MVVGAAIQCSSFSLGQLIASRWLTGFGNGMVGSNRLQNLCHLTDLYLEYLDSPNVAVGDV